MENQNNPNKTKSRGKKRGGGILSTLILLVALGVFIYAGYNLFQIYYGYYEGDKEYHALEDLAITIEEEGEEERYRVDFDALWEVNEDIKAWIRFDEPASINYPVVRGKDNAEYLTRTISGYDNTYGALFIDVANSETFRDTRTIIYGHKMKSGSMFGDLDKYADKAFWESYPNFYIYTPDGAELTYTIFASGVIKEDSQMYNSSFRTGEEILEFIEYCKTFAEYDTGVDVKVGEKMIVLSTCTNVNQDDRYVVCAVQTATKK